MTISSEQFDALVRTLRLIAHGNESPGGLEGLAMSLAGDKIRLPVGPALHELAQAVDRHAEVISEAIVDAAKILAKAIEGTRG